MILDATTMTTVADLPAQGFLRLNQAGDGRRMLLTEGDAFRVLDPGVWTKAHGDHGHSYAAPPQLTDLRFTGPHPGHVVTHGDSSALFFDGSGEYLVLDPRLLSNEHLPPVTRHATASAHHGVAVPLHDGVRLETIGTEKERVGARAVGASGEVARAENCPGVHGEAVAAKERVVLGCTNGMLIFDGKTFTKVTSPDAYGRIGNVAGHQSSTVVLGDYKVDKAAKLERPRRISLVDTQTAGLRLVDLPASYSFRSLGRGPAGEALVLGDDGVLRVIDPVKGTIAQQVSVTKPWVESETWQDPRPTLRVVGDRAYVTEPASSTVHVIDAKAWTLISSSPVPHVPNEVEGVLG